ncbi:Protein NRT1/ PTR FAMILY 3.1 [Hibiscus syriacus]|uniref:Protein NRT1/ PTR FAMILY 3.1 n=1 Tax=Hibiscus syriacus TaxID=106335 RepID=A0A6A3AMT4_HIBSY|nr:Protein NRT1/ PTR FAMILY 3.1 [Hibiscus syriacus]
MPPQTCCPGLRPIWHMYWARPRYYFALGVAVLIALTVIVYIQGHVECSLGLGIPTITMALSIIVFLIGYPLYRNLDPAGSPYTRVLQICAASFRKRKIPLISDPKFCMSTRFLDKAAIVTEEDGVVTSEKPSFWRLNTVYRVEELKCIFRMLPIWAAGILSATADAQQNTFSLQHGNTMDKHLTKSFEVPSASVSVFAKLSMLIMIVLYDRVLVHVADENRLFHLDTSNSGSRIRRTEEKTCSLDRWPNRQPKIDNSHLCILARAAV